MVAFESGRRLPAEWQAALRLLCLLSRFLELLSIEKHGGATLRLRGRWIIHSRLARELMLRHVRSQARLRSLLVLPRHWQTRH